MFKKLVALCLSLILASPVVAAPVFLASINQMHQEAWRDACKYKATYCEEIPMPQVWYTEMDRTMYGYYEYGAAGVHIRMNLLGTEFSRYVVVHEMVHYLQERQEETGYTGVLYRFTCVRESEAFNVVAGLALERGYVDPRIKSWGEASAYYPQCNL